MNKYLFYTIPSLFFLKKYHEDEAIRHGNNADLLSKQVGGDPPDHHLSMQKRHEDKLHKVNRAIKIKT